MNIDTNSILALPASDKMRLIELLWEDLSDSNEKIDMPDWIEQEAIKRRNAMLEDPKLGYGHDETWKQILGPDE